MVGCLSEIEDELENKEIDVLVKLFKSNTFKSLLKVCSCIIVEISKIC